MKKFALLLMMNAMLLVSNAQDVVYLIGTDGVMEANHASATLTKNDKGAYTGEVTIIQREFTITTQLGSSSDDWNSIWPYRWGPKEEWNDYVFVGEERTILTKLKYNDNSGVYARSLWFLPEEDWEGDGWKRTYWVKITFEQAEYGHISIYNNRTEDPDDPSYKGEGGGEDPAVPGSGNHFKINVPQAGMLKQRLENAVLDNSDEDSVDSLTVKGKFGGADLKYLIEEQAILSELVYLDLSAVELVFDDEPYASRTYQLNAGTYGGIQIFQTDIYTLSKENKEEDDPGNFSGALLNKTTYYRRNDFAFAFKGNEHLKDCRLPKSMPGIGEDIFKDANVLKKVTLPDNPNHIGDNAFKGTALKSFTLPSSVESIGDYAFADVPIEDIDLSHVRNFGVGCLSGTKIKNIKLADGIESIPEEIFSNCQSLKDVVIPSSVKTIGKGAFSGCNNLYAVKIPGTVTTIGQGAFAGCGSLRHLTIEEGVKTIEESAFAGCDFLQAITIPSTLEEVGAYAFPILENMTYENGILYMGKVAYALELGDRYNSKLKEGITSLNIKEGTVSIADKFQINACSNRSHSDFGYEAYGISQIKAISLPSTLRRIGIGNFYGTGISSITLPDKLEYIGKSAFYGCEKLRRITIPENVKYIGTGAFSGCGIMRVYYNAIEADVYKWVDVNGTVQYNYGNYIFADCPLVRVYIEEGVKKIPATLFSDCSSLARVQMASTVESIGDQAFSGCTSLEHIDLPSSLKEIANSALPIANLKSVACYMKEPFNLGSSDEDVFAHVISEDGATVYDVWQEELANGEDYHYGNLYPQTPLGTATGYYRIDAKGKISWGYFETFNSYYLGSEVLEDAEVVRLWQKAMDRGEEYYYGTWYKQTERVGDVECYYRIDANKNVSFGYWIDGEFKIDKNNMMWTDKIPTTEYGHIALLQVPKGQLSVYQSHPLWSAFVDKIEALDGASDVEPVSQTTIVNVSESVKESTDLSNTMMGNIYVTLDVEGSGDGYNAQEGCLIINSTTSEEGLSAATADDAEDLTVKNLYNGLILEVPGGKGKIIVDCQTLGQNVVFLKIGDAVPQKITTDSRQQLSVPYDVKNNTHVYIYAAKAPSGANSNSLRAAYANDDAVKLYGLTVQVDSKNVITGDVNGDGTINAKDVLAIVNKILDKPDADFNETAADVNKDGIVNIADVIGVKNIIIAH